MKILLSKKICSGVARAHASPTDYGSGSGQIWLDNVNCAGNEANIADCQSRGWGVADCTHNEDAGNAFFIFIYYFFQRTKA